MGHGIEERRATRNAPSGGELKVRLSRTSDDGSVSLAGLNQEPSQKKKVHGFLRLPQMPLDHILPNHLRRPLGRFEWPGTFFGQIPRWTIDRTEGERYLWVS
jgi:hypothetical protein